jgi:hypothetical protein
MIAAAGESSVQRRPLPLVLMRLPLLVSRLEFVIPGPSGVEVVHSYGNGARVPLVRECNDICLRQNVATYVCRILACEAQLRV